MRPVAVPRASGLAVGLGNAAGFAGDAMKGEKGLFLLEPELITGAAPVVEVLALDGFAMEFGVEDFSNRRKAVEPGKDVGGRLTVEKAAVEFVADVIGEPGDFAGEMAVGWLSGFAIDFNNFFLTFGHFNRATANLIVSHYRYFFNELFRQASCASD